MSGSGSSGGGGRGVDRLIVQVLPRADSAAEELADLLNAVARNTRYSAVAFTQVHASR